MIILDTNVVSELLREEAAPIVVEWARGNAEQLYTTVITEAEVRYGVELLASGRRRRSLERLVDDIFDKELAHRILPFDRAAARAYSVIVASRRAAGKPISPFDAQIAAIAQSVRASLATRNEPDFSGCGLTVVNPWRS